MYNMSDHLPLLQVIALKAPLTTAFFQHRLWSHNRQGPYNVNMVVAIWGSHQTLWSLPLPNVTLHSGTWPYTMTPWIDQTLHQFANLLPNWTIIPILTLLPNFGGFHRTLQRVRLANRGRLLLRTPGPVQVGTCICSNVETILSWTCYIYGPFEFRTALGTSILLLLKYIDVNIITFCRPDKRVFYFFCSKRGTSYTAPLLISRCEETLICPVLWQLYYLKGMSLYAHLSPCSIGSFAFLT